MDKRIILYVIIGLLISGLLIMTFFPNMIYAWRDSGESGEDKCVPPEGQTKEEWKEHMSHHPDIYRECL
jgi:hypothetical protein